MTPNVGSDFPWHLGIYDAHCHPTDTMSSIPDIPTMQARCLTVMGTRGQDQSLVSQVADKYGVKSADRDAWSREECIVPCFGWHPWFSHMMHLEDGDGEPRILQGKDKIHHYQNVLQPSRESLSEEDKRIFQSLPDPIPFSAFLEDTRKNLSKYPFALVGEIGLDRSFRIPEAWGPDRESERDETLTPGGREGRRLTPFRCSPKHQKEIFKRQLQLAAEYRRAVSIHGVQAHGLVFESLKELWEGHEKPVLSKREKKKRGADHSSVEGQLGEKPEEDSTPKPYPPRICLHSYSGLPAHLKTFLHGSVPADIFFSFSSAINMDNGRAKAEQVIKALPDDKILIESDLHIAGDEMDRRMEEICREICEIKGWSLADGVTQ